MRSILHKIRDRFYVPLASSVMRLNSVLINSTIDLEFISEEAVSAVHKKGHRAIFAFWHQSTFSLLHYYRNRDLCMIPVDNYLGGILASLAGSMGYKIIRYPQNGSPAARMAAIVRVIRAIKEGRDCGIAVDGPPDEKLHKAKPGVFMLAQKTGFPVIPVGVHYSDPIVFRSRWDRYLMPKPFSSAVILLGDPIYVDEGASSDDIDLMCGELEEKLHGLTKKAGHISASKRLKLPNQRS